MTASQWMIHTITESATGEITRFVIAPQGGDVGARAGETVTASQLLARRLGAPVTVLTRTPPAQPFAPSMRVSLGDWRAELGLEARPARGDELAAAFFAPTDGAEGR
jgi:hypothetical protein